jgi:molybdopterin molybdotransferase
MLDFDSARRRFLEVAVPLGSERISVTAAAGRVLAEPLFASRAVPEFDTSAMDGYAIHSDDASASPFCLPVEGEAPAGACPGKLVRGTALRIFTGAAVPEGANAVVMQEHVDRDERTIKSQRRVLPGQNIRRRGEDLAQSALALEGGTRLHPPALALVSYLNLAEIAVARAPIVTIVCTGSELRPPGSSLEPGVIAESNSASIAALARQAGAYVQRVELVDDDGTRIVDAMSRALAVSDVVVTIGGVSVGDYDLVRPALQAAGVELEIHKVGIKPGKPITLGRRGHKVVVGLPGNPASAVITFALFGMPLLRKMQGDRCPIPYCSWVPLAATIKRDPTRTRVVLGNLIGFEGRVGFSAHENQTSGATVALGQTTGFVVVEPGQQAAECGAWLEHYRWTDL